jgi:uncharacterized protein (TIGR00251 family)
VRADAAGATLLQVLVQPQSRRSTVDGLRDGALRIRLAAPAIEGRANAALVAWLADQLGLRQREVVLLQGERTRRKLLRISAGPERVEGWLDRVLAADS